MQFSCNKGASLAARLNVAVSVHFTLLLPWRDSAAAQSSDECVSWLRNVHDAKMHHASKRKTLYFFLFFLDERSSFWKRTHDAHAPRFVMMDHGGRWASKWRLLRTRGSTCSHHSCTHTTLLLIILSSKALPFSHGRQPSPDLYRSTPICTNAGFSHWL